MCIVHNLSFIYCKRRYHVHYFTIHLIKNRISVSGVQEKFPAIIKSGEIRIAGDDERSTHILKPAPWDKTLRDRKLIPANEHLTMQIAS